MALRVCRLPQALMRRGAGGARTRACPRPSAPARRALATLACPSTDRHMIILHCPTPGTDAAWPADGARRARAPQALLNAFEPGAVVTGTVSEHLLGHGILVDVGGMYDGCAANPTPPFALARRRAAASARTWCRTGRQSTSLMLGSGVTDGDCCAAPVCSACVGAHAGVRRAPCMLRSSALLVVFL